MNGFLISNIPEQLANVTLLSVTVPLILAVILGGIIGIERGAHGRPAGFRTHVLVCLGACLAMVTNQYVFENISGITDPTRMAAQVITGVGFLGVGTILITGKYRIKGLTTAAGLWASACIGLAVGIGFYAGAILAGIIILIVLILFVRIEGFFYSKSRWFELYIEIESLRLLKEIKIAILDKGIVVKETHLGSSTDKKGNLGVQITVEIPQDMTHEEAIEAIAEIDGILLIEEC